MTGVDGLTVSGADPRWHAADGCTGCGVRGLWPTGVESRHPMQLRLPWANAAAGLAAAQEDAHE